MKNELMELMRKKGRQEMDPMKHKARGNMLDELKKAMDSELGEDVKGLKKVTVASNDKEGLSAGLNKAEEMLEGEESEEDSHEMPDGKMMEDSEMEMPEPSSPEECDKMIKMLEMKKMAMEKNK